MKTVVDKKIKDCQVYYLVKEIDRKPKWFKFQSLISELQIVLSYQNKLKGFNVKVQVDSFENQRIQLTDKAPEKIKSIQKNRKNYIYPKCQDLSSQQFEQISKLKFLYRIRSKVFLFEGLLSNGKTIKITNQQLKRHNPNLLFKFYEEKAICQFD